jgi:hypothetical protein
MLDNYLQYIYSHLQLGALPKTEYIAVLDLSSGASASLYRTVVH